MIKKLTATVTKEDGSISIHTRHVCSKNDSSAVWKSHITQMQKRMERWHKTWKSIEVTIGERD